MNLILITILFCFSIQTFVYSQTLQCPPNDTCTSWTSYADTISINTSNTLKAFVHYRVQKCNGQIRFIIDSATAIDHAKYLDTFQIYHHEFNSFKNLLEVSLMSKVSFYFGSSVPDCNVDTVLNIQFYTAMCGVWLKCSYKVNTTSVICDSGYNSAPPHYEMNGEWWVDYYRWHPCGKTCCKKTYKICIGRSDVFNHIRMLKITQLSRNRIGDCTLKQQFKDWKNPTQTVPCGDDC